MEASASSGNTTNFSMELGKVAVRILMRYLWLQSGSDERCYRADGASISHGAACLSAATFGRPLVLFPRAIALRRAQRPPFFER
jgi:hypothetical protein